MGKSSKKVKNDRINTLRKQYDAYLEEDKKRKERNEYILGKLDKMRSSSALVPISSKASYHQEDPSDIYMRSSNLRKATVPMYDNYVSHLEPQNMTSDIINKQFDESTILKEISKRYILIPKRRMPLDRIEYASNKDTINDNDWRSKYNILDNLKQQEKEERSDTATDKNNDILNRPYKDPEPIYDKQSHNFDNDSNQTAPNVNVNKFNPNLDNKINKTVDFEIPEDRQIDDNKKLSLQTTSVSSNEGFKVDSTKSSIVDPINNAVTYDTEPQHDGIEEKEKYYSDINEKHVNYEQNQDIDSNMQISQGDNSNEEHYQENAYLANHNQPMPESNEYEGYENVNSTAYPEEIVSDVKLQEPSVVADSEKQVILNENIEKQNNVNNVQDIPYSEPVQPLNVADTDKRHGGQMEADQITYDTPQGYDPTQDNNPVVLENTEHTEQIDHDSEINAFEAEQKEMFYSEQTGDNTYAYNQGDSNTGEYPAQGYEQDNQYAYFEGVQQEQAYTTNVNEHEEATERYDPHYNQQYEGVYENQQPDNITNYENANPYEQQQYQEGSYENQQFENVVNYESQQENPNLYQQENVNIENEVQENVMVQDNEVYDQHLYADQPETQEHIEQQLEAEEGYVENPPISTGELKPEHEGDIERVTDIPPAEQIPEPKFS